jgi:YVTN family beta-propeller protein
MKKTSLAVAITAGLAIAAGSLLTALPASALATVSTAEVIFHSWGNSYSSASGDGATIAYAGYDENRITLLDTATLVPTIVTDPDSYFRSPGASAFSPDGATLYVTNYDADNIVVIDVATATATGTLESGDFSGPWSMAISPDGTKLYVGDYDDYTIVEYNLATNLTTVTETQEYPYYLVASLDGSKVYAMGYYGPIDVYNTQTHSIDASFTNVSGEFENGCTNANVTTMYLPDATTDNFFAVSLITGEVTASNLATEAPEGTNNTTCAVSPDGSKVFLTNEDVGLTHEVEYSIITAPGIITQYDAATLAYEATYEFSGVAYTQQMNFYDDCNAFVAGYYGNAQSFNFDDACVVGAGEEAQSGIGSGAALAKTGSNAGGIGALVALLTAASAIVFTLRRRIALK